MDGTMRVTLATLLAPTLSLGQSWLRKQLKLLVQRRTNFRIFRSLPETHGERLPEECEDGDGLPMPPLNPLPEVATCAVCREEEQQVGTCAVCREEEQQVELLLLDCGHSYCRGCLEGQLLARWSGPRVSFGYLSCGLCRRPLAHPALEPLLQPHRELRARALDVAEAKLRADGLDKPLRARLGHRPSRQALRAQAEEEMAVHECSHCGGLYCAGRVACAALTEAAAGAEGRPSLCEDCSWRRLSGRRCDIHGPEHAIFKCQLCCSLAVWRCGVQHYCDRCHSSPHGVKPCPGPGLCPLGLPHPPNGACPGPGAAGPSAGACVVGCTACMGYEAEEGGAASAAMAGWEEWQGDEAGLDYEEEWGKEEWLAGDEPGWLGDEEAEALRRDLHLQLQEIAEWEGLEREDEEGRGEEDGGGGGGSEAAPAPAAAAPRRAAPAPHACEVEEEAPDGVAAFKARRSRARALERLHRRAAGLLALEAERRRRALFSRRRLRRLRAAARCGRQQRWPTPRPPARHRRGGRGRSPRSYDDDDDCRGGTGLEPGGEVDEDPGCHPCSDWEEEI